MMALAFICGVALLFALVLVCEGQPGSDEPLRPPGLLRWLISGNWTAKLGALLLTIGSGALLRYLMLNLTYPPGLKILTGAALAALFGIGGALLAARPGRRAISLALTGAALAVAYLTAYSAYGFFHYVADPQALGLLFIVASVATVIAITRRSVSLAVLAMAGAYLAPGFALHGSDPLPVYGYYAVASLITLCMVWLRGWRPLIHLSFLFTLGGALFFAWTQKFYTPEHYAQMQPLLFVLVAIHLAMPLLESGAAGTDADAAIWRRRFDQAYFLTLPLVAAVLTLLLAPRIGHEGALGLVGLAALWLAATGWEALRSGAGTTRYLAVALVLLLIAGVLAVTDVPVFLIAAVVSCLAIAASQPLKLNRETEWLVLTMALAASSCYVLQAAFAPASGVVLLNLPFAEHLLLGGALLAATLTLHRRGHSLAPVFGIYCGAWLLLTLARELLRLHYMHGAELLYVAVLAAIGACVILSQARRRAPNRIAIAVFGLGLLVSGIASAARFPPGYLLPLLLAGQIMLSLLALACDRNDVQDEAGGATARSALPIVALPWAIALSQHWAAGNDDMILTILVSSALLASIQAQWLVRKGQVWPNWLSPVGFTLFGIVLFQETLFRIEREAWAVAFEVIALVYLVESARFLWVGRHRDAAFFGYVAIAAVAAVSAAMLLRLIGPPGTLTILALNEMLLPAFVSLLWAAIGAVLTWLSTRKRSRMLWSLGAVLMLASAVKLILFDFGSLGQIANILAMMAAGGVFLLVAWLAPFPPKAEHQAPAAAAANRHPESVHRGWLWVAVALLVLLAYGYHFLMVKLLPNPVAVTVPPPPIVTRALADQPKPPEDDCQRFVHSLPADYLVFAAGDSTAAAQAPGVMQVQVNGAGQAVVLALGSAGPTVWDVHVQESENVVGVILSGLQRSTLNGVPAAVPVLHAARDDHAPCGYFQINPDTPQGANGFVSRLLVHAVDATFQADNQVLRVIRDAPEPAPAPRPTRIDVGAATYSSWRNGHSREITSIIRAQCADSQGSCTVRCGNQLAGDPDFGQVKSCQIIYTCGASQTHTMKVQEGTDLQLRCD
jgi:uncharacterized membrane protein